MSGGVVHFVLIVVDAYIGVKSSMYVVVVKRWKCAAFPDSIQYLKFTKKEKNLMYDFLSGLRLTDTPYGVIEVEKGKEKTIDVYMSEELLKVLKEVKEDGS